MVLKMRKEKKTTKTRGSLHFISLVSFIYYVTMREPHYTCYVMKHGEGVLQIKETTIHMHFKCANCLNVWSKILPHGIRFDFCILFLFLVGHGLWDSKLVPFSLFFYRDFVQSSQTWKVSFTNIQNISCLHFVRGFSSYLPGKTTICAPFLSIPFQIILYLVGSSTFIPYKMRDVFV